MSSEIFTLNSPRARSVNLQKFFIWAARAESCGITYEKAYLVQRYITSTSKHTYSRGHRECKLTFRRITLILCYHWWWHLHLNFAKKLFGKLSLDNLCKRSLNSRPRYFKLSVKQTVDNNSYIRKNEKRFVNNWCCTWKSRDLNAAIVGRLPLSSFSVSVSP